jgi:hypothetical protein
VREGLVGLRHAVRVFALAHGRAAVLGRIQQFVRQAVAIDFSLRSRAASITQRIASVWRRLARTSTGTW